MLMKQNFTQINFGPNNFFSKYKVTTFRGEHLQEISHSFNVSFLYKLVFSAKGTDYLSIGFGRDHPRRQDELTPNENVKSKISG